MLRLAVVFLFILFSGMIFAKNIKYETQCGKYKYVIVVEDAESYYTARIKHYYQRKGDIKKKLFYQSEHGMYVEASCTKDKNSADVFVFSEECSGSGCVDSVYGLFNLEQKKMLLKPADWPKGNEEELINLVGNSNFLNLTHRPSRFKDNEFCCFNELLEYQATLSADTRSY